MSGHVIGVLVAAAVLAGSAAGAQEKVRIGYAISKSGPYAGGAAITTLPAYITWVKDVNAAGGLTLKGADKKRPIEVVEYDDRSDPEELARAVARLATEDKVDFILPPWGSAFNLAAAPILNRAGYPHLAVTVPTRHAAELAKRWPNTFFLLGTPEDGVQELTAMLSRLRDDNKIGATVAMVNVADPLALELATAAREAFQKAGFTLVYDRSYPIGIQDLRPILTEAKASNADSFVAFSYAPDTLAITQQAIALNFNPKVFYAAFGTAFPSFKQRFGGHAEGVMGLGGINPEAQAFRDYAKRHAAANGGREPDRWANPVTYASLQMLQQAIERVGTLDRKAVIKELQAGSFDTIIGPVKLKGHRRLDAWEVGQWQGHEFYGIAPPGLDGAKPAVVPKPEWK